MTKKERALLAVEALKKNIPARYVRLNIRIRCNYLLQRDFPHSVRMPV